MPKALFINYLGEGHVNPSLGLVKELIARGEEIVYYSSNPYEEKIKKTGAEFRPISAKAQSMLERFFTYYISSMINVGNFSRRMPIRLEMMEWITDGVLEETKSESYDYIIYDAQSMVGKWIADIKKLPSISTGTIFASNLNSNFFQKIRKQRGPEFQKVFQEIKAEMKVLKSRLEQKYSISIADFPQMMISGADLNIIFTSRYFQPDSELFGDNYLFVGPSITDREDKGDFPFEKLKDSPVVYMALGTLVNNRPDLYKICMESLQELDVKVVLSIGKRLSTSSLGTIPDNFIVRNYVPQLDVLRHSDVFITHCGMNSTSEGLYFNTPLVMLPMMNDQPIVADQVKELGAGIILDHQTLDPKDLRDSVQEVLNNPIYKQNSEKISRSFREAGGYIKAADELLRWVSQHQKS